VAKARTRARPPGRRGPSGKQTGRSSKSTAKRSRTTVAAERVTASSKQALAPHRRDIQGVALLVFSILLAMAVWWHVAGLGMRWADVLLRGMFGYGAYGLPVLAATLGVIVLRNRDPLDEPVAGRVVIGGLAILLGGVGLLHLAKGAPPMSAGVLTLQESGGFCRPGAPAPSWWPSSSSAC
jgi:S-DNA-T family DNA segregation ATPase FtsK/SpoIIIE